MPALLSLGLHEGMRAWKSFDWDALSRLHGKAFICNRVGKAKPVALSEEGKGQAGLLLRELFGRR